MSKVVIKKKISLEFLGKDYAEGYLEFKSVSFKEYQEYLGDGLEDKPEKEAVEIITNIINKHFLGGKFPDEEGKLFELTKEDINDFDLETIIKVFKILTGQDDSKKE